MCGIIGFLAKDVGSRESLGQMIVPMFNCMAERGPDSAGLACFGPPVSPDRRRFSLFAPARDYDWPALATALGQATTELSDVRGCENHAILVSAIAPERLRSWLRANAPIVRVLSVGRAITVYKDTGDPIDVARRYRFAALGGTHAIGHTRMATESSISPAHAHPFTAGEDFSLVHNGSLSNPYMLRRTLEADGLAFETDNDSEAACRYLEWRMRKGESLDEALAGGFDDLDGFFTLLIATKNQLTLVRDAFACKPAVVAETDRYVAISSEFRSLTHLPDIADADIFEPLPEEIYTWRV
jgi:methylamine---glutamate N-methyltransferase subunit A